MAVAPTFPELDVRSRVSVIDPTGDPRWDAFVDQSPLASPFHHSSWANVLIDSYDYEPRYHILERGERIVAGWPAMLVSSRLTGTRLVSLPFADYCPPLASSDEDTTLLAEAMLTDAERLNASRVEVRGWPAGLRPVSSLVASGGYVRHVIDLRGGLDATRSRLSDNARRSLKKARGFGVSTRLAEGDEDLDRFVELNLSLRRKHRMLPQPRRFFESVWARLIQPGRGYVLFAERERRPLAALLCLRQGLVTLDKFAVNEQSQNQFRGSHAAMWAVIEREIHRGASWYDMGRSDASADSLHRFKEQWGGQKSDATYYFHPAAGGVTTEDPKGMKKLGLDTFARVAPDALFKAAGNLLYRHIG